MAKRQYIADSSFLLLSCLAPRVRSDVAGGSAAVTDIGSMPDGMSLFIIAPCIG